MYIHISNLRHWFQSVQIPSTTSDGLEGAFVLMKIRVYRGGEGRRRMVQQTLDETTR